MRLPDGPIRKLRQSCEHPGSAHELTFPCYRRLPLLGRDRTRQWVIEAMVGRQDQYGQRFTVDFEFTGPKGREMIRSVWIVRKQESFPDLVTCYIL